MIEITCTPLEKTRSQSRSCLYRATCAIDGQSYEATRRMGAGNELARLLVAAGIPDQPVQVCQAGRPGHLAYRSLYRMAGFDFEEGATTPLHRVGWRPPPDFAVLHGGEAQNRGETESGGRGNPPRPLRPLNRLPPRN